MEIFLNKMYIYVWFHLGKGFAIKGKRAVDRKNAKISFAYSSENAHSKTCIQRLESITGIYSVAIPIIIRLSPSKKPYQPHFGTAY